MVATRRNPGEGGLHWEESRQRWFATVYVGYAPNGKRRKVKISARTKTEAKAKLRQLVRDQEDGHVLGGQTYTMRDAVESWLAHGLIGRQQSTVVNRTILARTHVIPALGARKLARLSAEEVDDWLATKAKTPSTDTLHRLMSILRQSIRRAQARDLVKRNVALSVTSRVGRVVAPRSRSPWHRPRSCSPPHSNTRACTPTSWCRCSRVPGQRSYEH